MPYTRWSLANRAALGTTLTIDVYRCRRDIANSARDYRAQIEGASALLPNATTLCLV